MEDLRVQFETKYEHAYKPKKSVWFLLKQIRNKKIHESKTTTEALELYKRYGGVTSYWVKLFPRLVLHLYITMQKYRNEERLRKFYTQEDYHFNPVNELLKPLKDQTCIEEEQVTFRCKMLDEEGDAEWRVAGNVVTKNDRVQTMKLYKGVHQLIILSARLSDSGDVSCTSGQIETKAKVVVNKAEVVVEAKVQDAAARKHKQPQVTRHRNKFVK